MVAPDDCSCWYAVSMSSANTQWTVEPADLKTERITIVLLGAFDVGDRQLRNGLAIKTHACFSAFAVSGLSVCIAPSAGDEARPRHVFLPEFFAAYSA
jgi:hypothetical protein